MYVKICVNVIKFAFFNDRMLKFIYPNSKPAITAARTPYM